MNPTNSALEQASNLLGHDVSQDTSLDTPEALSRALAKDARKHLDTIRKGWRYVLDPIQTTGAGATQGGPHPATEDDVDTPPDARFDTPVTLAFWVHAAIDEWPTILQTLEPDAHGQLRLVTTRTIDCSDVHAMTTFLDREADRLAGWVDAANDYGARFLHELATAARSVSRVAWPPKGDRLTIGECPSCGRRVRVKAPAWHRKPLPFPVPTTDPATYPLWTWLVTDDSPWAPDRQAPIACRCSEDGTLEEWREKIAGPPELLTAEEVVADLAKHFGVKYQPLTVRTWQRRGMIQIACYSRQGHALYDRTQVLAAYIDRERQRDRAS